MPTTYTIIEPSTIGTVITVSEPAGIGTPITNSEPASVGTPITNNEPSIVGTATRQIEPISGFGLSPFGDDSSDIPLKEVTRGFGEPTTKHTKDNDE